MEYRVLGKTGIGVSSVGIGCLQFGGDKRWTGITDEESIATIHAAEGLGVNLLDTARSYGDPDGHSEEVIGRAVHDRRERYVIASKFRPITDDPDESRAREWVFKACDGSLGRMRTDYIDVYQLHAVPHESTMPAVMDALAELKVQGKVRWFGISNNDVGVIRKLLALGDISVLQVGYNLLSSSGEDALKLAMVENLGVLVRVPLARGVLTGKYFRSMGQFDAGDERWGSYTSKDMTASLKKLSKLLFLTKGTGRTMVQAALRFILDTDGVTSVIPGARNRTQLADNAGAASKSALSAEERSRAISIAHAAGFEF